MRSFSNFSGHGFDLDGHWWTTSEHYFQAQKFPGSEHQDAIRKSRSPVKAKGMGRSRKYKLRPDWEHVKDAIMRKEGERLIIEPGGIRREFDRSLVAEQK